MSDLASTAWTVERFFAWQERQAERFELVGGVPVPVAACVESVYADIVANLISELRSQLKGSACRPFTGDRGIETLPGQIRRPDAGVDCGERDPLALKATRPRLVAEVLSPTARDIDTLDKLHEYRAAPSVQYVLVVEPNLPEVVWWSRAGTNGWVRQAAEGMQQAVDFPAVGVTLALSAIYEDVRFP